MAATPIPVDAALWQVGFVWSACPDRMPPPTRDEIEAAVRAVRVLGDPDLVLDLVEPVADGIWLCRLSPEDGDEAALLGYLEIELGTILAQVEMP